jgi:hypothetical protein
MLQRYAYLEFESWRSKILKPGMLLIQSRARVFQTIVHGHYHLFSKIRELVFARLTINCGRVQNVNKRH